MLADSKKTGGAIINTKTALQKAPLVTSKRELLETKKKKN